MTLLSKQEIIDKIYHQLDSSPKKAIGIFEIQEIDTFLTAISANLHNDVLLNLLFALTTAQPFQEKNYKAMQLAFDQLSDSEKAACVSEGDETAIFSHLRLQIATNQFNSNTHPHHMRSPMLKHKLSVVNQIYHAILSANNRALALEDLQQISEFLSQVADKVTIEVLDALLIRAKFRSLLPENVYYDLQKGFANLDESMKRSLKSINQMPIAIRLIRQHFNDRNHFHRMPTMMELYTVN